MTADDILCEEDTPARETDGRELPLGSSEPLMRRMSLEFGAKCHGHSSGGLGLPRAS